jgi:hypothetical protein
MKKLFFCVIIGLNCLPHCTEDLTPPAGNNQVLITTNALSAITSSSVLYDVTVVADGGSAITERGIVAGIVSSPNISSNLKKVKGSGLGRFSDTIGGLSANTVYYLRSYAINKLGTVYGDQQSFMTLLRPPALTSPANGAQATCCTISFQWTSVANANQYEIEIAKSNSFSSSAFSISNCTGTATLQYTSVNKATVTNTNFCVRSGTAINNGTWYWRVRARSTANFSPWTTPRIFSYVY